MSFNHSQLVYFAKLTLTLYDRHPDDAKLIKNISYVANVMYTTSQAAGIIMDISEYFEALNGDIIYKPQDFAIAKAELVDFIKEELNIDLPYEITARDQQEVAIILYKIYVIEEDNVESLRHFLKFIQSIKQKVQKMDSELVKLSKTIADRLQNLESLVKEKPGLAQGGSITMEYPELAQYVTRLIDDAKQVGLEKLTHPGNYEAIRIAQRLQYGIDMNTGNTGPIHNIIVEISSSIRKLDIDSVPMNKSAWEEIISLGEELKSQSIPRN